MFTNSCMCSKVWPKVCALASETERESKRESLCMCVLFVCERVFVWVCKRERKERGLHKTLADQSKATSKK